jgi:hypothetical protein
MSYLDPGLGARHRCCQRSIDTIHEPEHLEYTWLLPTQLAKEIAEEALLRVPVLHIEAEVNHQIFASRGCVLNAMVCIHWHVYDFARVADER